MTDLMIALEDSNVDTANEVMNIYNQKTEADERNTKNTGLIDKAIVFNDMRLCVPDCGMS